MDAALTALRPPTGAVPAPEPDVRGEPHGPVTDSGCFDDHSGVPWAYAAGTYTGSYADPGAREQVREHYRAAVADGWQQGPGADGPDGGLCFTRTIDGHPSLLTVDFTGYAPDSGGYRVEVGHSVDGAAARCHAPAATRY
ncbi:hypothetical protein [Kitasatospora phosalacinea]|uniref:hypothetical protein n=1 Tax=Kitasatospora phosalacinea TaxID=2065 RepID=UPI00068AEB54|nr:hypothetical protein [Kitasatospora phosalacinea]